MIGISTASTMVSTTPPITRIMVGSSSAVSAIARPKALRATGLGAGVVTRGGRGVIAFDQESEALVVPPDIPALGDVTGAGDSLASGFLSAWTGGATICEALRHGVAAAAITVRSPLAVAEEMSRTALADALSLVPEAEILS